MYHCTLEQFDKYTNIHICIEESKFDYWNTLQNSNNPNWNVYAINLEKFW